MASATIVETKLQAWRPKDGKPNVFDDSFESGVNFPIGKGQGGK